jgi:hypothetical protein
LALNAFVSRLSSVGCAGQVRVLSVAVWPQGGPDSQHVKITFGTAMILARRALRGDSKRVALKVERVRCCGVFDHDQREVSVDLREPASERRASR